MYALRLAFLLCFFAPGFASCAQKAYTTIKQQSYIRVHFPNQEGKYPAIIAIGGSEGGYSFHQNLADSFKKHGFIFVQLAYFNTEGTDLPKTLEEIPLEYFEKVLDTVKNIPQVDTSKIGILCISKGTEPGLYLATKRREIKAVTAHVPSHVFWYGLTSWKASGNSSWTIGNKPVPFVPYGKPKSGWFTKNISEYYEAGLEKNSHKINEALIKVENMHCHLLITSGTDDKMWPSAVMGKKIEEKLTATNYKYYFIHQSYPNAGHGIFRTPLSGNNYPEYLEKMGGTKEGNIAAINQNWTLTINFFLKYLAG